MLGEYDREAGSAPENRTFVLVHGAWHGGWCYARTAHILRSRGHRVFTPTLSGLAERSNGYSGAINLSIHITDIVNLVKWEGLDDFILCGHSYGGMVITGVAERIAARIRALVYLDAFVPESGQSLWDLADPAAIPVQIGFAGSADGIGIPPLPAELLGVNEDDRAWVDGQCTPQPIATFTERLKTVTALASVPHKTYVLATGYGEGGPFGRYPFYQRLLADPGWTKKTMPGGHDLMIDLPEEVACLLEAAGH